MKTIIPITRFSKKQKREKMPTCMLSSSESPDVADVPASWLVLSSAPAKSVPKASNGRLHLIARRKQVTTTASPPCNLSPPLPPPTHTPTTMSVSALIRCASRARATPFARPAPRALFVQQPVQRAAFSASAGRFAGDVDAHDPHHEESFEEFTARYAESRFCFFPRERWGGELLLEERYGGI